MKRRLMLAVAIVALLLSVPAAFADERPASPPGTASTQIGEAWIDVTYSRPILRGRTGIFGSGEEYGKTVIGGAEYWRVGANATTKLKTEVDLEIGGKKVPAGEYGVVVGLDEKAWTLVLTTQKTMDKWMGREEVAKGVMWGSYGYKPDSDVARAKMELDTLDHSVDQMTIAFLDVTDAGATLAISWEKTRATVELKVAK